MCYGYGLGFLLLLWVFLFDFFFFVGGWFVFCCVGFGEVWFGLVLLGFKENVTIWEALAKSCKICGAVIGCGLGWGFVWFRLGFFRCKENKAVTSVSVTQLCQVYYMLHSRVFTFLVNHFTWNRSIF